MGRGRAVAAERGEKLYIMPDKRRRFRRRYVFTSVVSTDIAGAALGKSSSAPQQAASTSASFSASVSAPTHVAAPVGPVLWPEDDVADLFDAIIRPKTSNDQADALADLLRRSGHQQELLERQQHMLSMQQQVLGKQHLILEQLMTKVDMLAQQTAGGSDAAAAQRRHVLEADPRTAAKDRHVRDDDSGAGPDSHFELNSGVDSSRNLGVSNTDFKLDSSSAESNRLHETDSSVWAWT